MLEEGKDNVALVNQSSLVKALDYAYLYFNSWGGAKNEACLKWC